MHDISFDSAVEIIKKQSKTTFLYNSHNSYMLFYDGKSASWTSLATTASYSQYSRFLDSFFMIMFSNVCVVRLITTNNTSQLPDESCHEGENVVPARWREKS